MPNGINSFRVLGFLELTELQSLSAGKLQNSQNDNTLDRNFTLLIANFYE
jgi:hypothetical protein